ncbi:hypothetical protein KFE25_012661 [Diacronema lutheri]|uniref:Protein UXT n=1 Tax=Diacronema lutheri TaxID=2081491 RepID=A0A8J5XC53_DIALT|nr:hypothetical protein KFE25_012661 [Diacronema lutheri]
MATRSRASAPARPSDGRAATAAAAAGALAPAEARQKIVEYEAFLRDKLQPDLAAALAALDGAHAELADALALRAQLSAIGELGARPLKMRVNLGNDFFAHALVPDTASVCVHVGLGFFAELRAGEALAFVDAKEARLNVRIGELSGRAGTIRAHVQVLLDAIAQLSGNRLAAGR